MDIIDYELAQLLISEGFELLEVIECKYAILYSFADNPTIEDFIFNYYKMLDI